MNWMHKDSFCCPEIELESKRARIIWDRKLLAVGPYARAHTLTLRVPNKTPYISMKTSCFRSILSFVEQAISFISRLRWSEGHHPTLQIEVYLSDHPKIWRPNPASASNIITPCDINSGETLFSSPTTRVIRIWRREDFHKVLIHELLHAYDWDRLIPNRVGFGAESEAFIEWMACVIHCFLIENSSKLGFWTVLKQEIKHAEKQVQALLTYGFRITAETSPQYYIILKYQLLVSFDQVWKWLLSSQQSIELQASWRDLRELVERKVAYKIRFTNPNKRSQTPEIPLALVSRQLEL